MLPEVISNGLASLQPGKVRYTKSAVMEFTDDGLRVSTELYSAAIRSSKRLTYEQVDEFLASLAHAPSSRPSVCHCFAEAVPSGVSPALLASKQWHTIPRSERSSAARSATCWAACTRWP